MIIDGTIPGDPNKIAKAEQEQGIKPAPAQAEEQPAEETKNAKPAKTRKPRAAKPVTPTTTENGAEQ